MADNREKKNEEEEHFHQIRQPVSFGFPFKVDAKSSTLVFLLGSLHNRLRAMRCNADDLTFN